MIDFDAMYSAIAQEGEDAWGFIYCAKDAKRPKKSRKKVKR